jgi:hypothetical protein
MERYSLILTFDQERLVNKYFVDTPAQCYVER